MLAFIKNWSLRPRGDRLGHLPRMARRPGPSMPRYFGLGFFLLAVLLVQQGSGWRWPLLTEWQGDNLYKQMTGFGLLAFIFYQWRFSILRAQGEPRKAAALAGRHKLFGSLAPLLFLGHSQALGYGYLQALSLVFLLVFFTGLCNVEIAKIHKPWFQPVWITAHVGLSMALLFLAAYHVYLSYAFK